MTTPKSGPAIIGMKPALLRMDTCNFPPLADRPDDLDGNDEFLLSPKVLNLLSVVQEHGLTLGELQQLASCVISSITSSLHDSLEDGGEISVSSFFNMAECISRLDVAVETLESVDFSPVTENDEESE